MENTENAKMRIVLPKSAEETAKEVAALLLEKWEVGTFSRFCDEPATFDDAGSEEIAIAILPIIIRARRNMDAIERWSRNSIHVSSTTPAASYARYYIGQYSRLNEEANRHLGTRYPVWKFLFDDGWRWSFGHSQHVTLGLRVDCPVFETISEAVQFGLKVEGSLGDLNSTCVTAPVQVPKW